MCRLFKILKYFGSLIRSGSDMGWMLKRNNFNIMYDEPASIGWVKFSNWIEMLRNNLLTRGNLKYGNRTTYRSIIVSYLPSRASLIIPSWSIMGSQNGEPKEGTFFVDWLSRFTLRSALVRVQPTFDWQPTGWTTDVAGCVCWELQERKGFPLFSFQLWSGWTWKSLEYPIGSVVFRRW